jgi:hypothetical protein
MMAVWFIIVFLILIEMGASIFLLKDDIHRGSETYANLALAVADSITTAMPSVAENERR